MLKMTVERITPEKAREYLSHNIDNRRLRHWWCNSIAGMMKLGENEIENSLHLLRKALKKAAGIYEDDDANWSARKPIIAPMRIAR